MIVLGIETSCDETGIALYDSEQGLLAHVLHSQIELHADYGGVVPELASRDHVRFLVPLIKKVLAQANITLADINGVAYTAGPGLVGALMTGVATGRSLAWALGVPAVAVHHMEGHLLAPMLEDNPPDFPFVALLVSGGHTLLARVEGIGRYEILGQSLDDAAGEAFDKTAKLLGLGYPGGVEIERIAVNAGKHDLHFPRPMTNRPGLDFSFSGLKTFARNTMMGFKERDQLNEQTRANIADAFQQAVVDTLVIKCRRAINLTGITSLVVAGGVSANRLLRNRLDELMQVEQGSVSYPRIEFCTDNGAMIAYAGYLRLKAGESESTSMDARARWSMQSLNAV